MVDVVVTPAVGGGELQTRRIGPIWTSSLTGYIVYISGTDVVYRKTVDGGATWGANTIVIATGTVQAMAVWYDRWTPGDTGTLIHVVGGQNSVTVAVQYRTLDTATDVLGGLVTVNANMSPLGVGTLSLTKARNDYLYVGGWNGSVRLGFFASIDGGASWAARSNTAFVDANWTNETQFDLHPGNEVDTEDIWLVQRRNVSNDVALKVYDYSADTWATTVIAVGITLNLNGQIDSATRLSDNHVILVASDDVWNSVHNVRVWDIAATGTITAKTNVLTGTQYITGVSIMVADLDPTLYVAYGRGATGSGDVSIYFRTSDDGGATWSIEQPYSEDLTGGVVWQHVHQAVNNTVGRFYAVWLVQAGPDAYHGNFNNSIVLLAAPGPAPTPEPIFPPGGSFTRALSGGAPGFITYISPDGRVYPLHTPHNVGRWVLSFAGFGTPPIDYITQRGPFQHGVTVRDFFLRPRVIQLLIRQAFCDRDAWWGGRAELLNEIRPNRQLTATGVTPGTLRIAETDGTLRDLSVFIEAGPRFEPRVSGQWDEWAFMEALRFIAHDPVAFDPAEVTATFTITLDAGLIFPITFPIVFGAGVVDDTLVITYPGTWLTFPIITIVGPIGTPRIDNITTGEKIEFSINIAAGRTITIDLTENAKTVVDDLGTNLIGAVTSDSDLATFHLAPDPEAPLGVNTLRLRGDNPTGATAVSLAYFVRYFGF